MSKQSHHSKRLQRGEVWIWTQELDQPPEPLEDFAAVLSAEERRRAKRFLRPRDGQRFTVARGMLRRRLSGLLEVPPAEIRFEYAIHGKPLVEAALPSGESLQFNLAHSDHLAILAATAGDAVGVDIERVRTVKSRDGIVAKHFSPRERAAFEGLDEAERQEAFFRVWTRKEAILKGIGTGLTLPLTSFDVSLDAQPPAALLGMRHPDHVSEPWTLQPLDAPTGFCAAVALGRGERFEVRYHDAP